MSDLKIYCKNCGESPEDCRCNDRTESPVMIEGRKDDSANPKKYQAFADILDERIEQVGRRIADAEIKHSHYHKDVSDYETIDIYVICDLYVNDNSGCIQHAVKKLLCCGNRGVKDDVKDLQEAIDTIQRKIEILEGKSE